MGIKIKITGIENLDISKNYIFASDMLLPGHVHVACVQKYSFAYFRTQTM